MADNDSLLQSTNSQDDPYSEYLKAIEAYVPINLGQSVPSHDSEIINNTTYIPDQETTNLESSDTLSPENIILKDGEYMAMLKVHANPDIMSGPFSLQDLKKLAESFVYLLFLLQK